MRTIAALLLTLVAAGTATAAQQTKTINLRDADGRKVGTATLTEAKGGVQVKVNVWGLDPGPHAIHIHNKGMCNAPDFVNAGDHFNPYEKKHGAHNPEGKHAGDLPNIDVFQDKKGKGSFLAEGVTFGKGKGSLTAGDGTALVVHRGPDDEKSDPAGQSGARIACGVISKGKK